jgi:hypothetical protein
MTVDELREQAESLGIDVDGRWGEERLLKEIATATPVSASGAKAPDREKVFPIGAYLKGSGISEPLQRMLRDLFRGQQRTKKAWGTAVSAVLSRRS